jgi:hypothetical protein
VFVCLLKANYISQRISLRKSRRIRGLWFNRVIQ